MPGAGLGVGFCVFGFAGTYWSLFSPSLPFSSLRVWRLAWRRHLLTLHGSVCHWAIFATKKRVFVPWLLACRVCPLSCLVSKPCEDCWSWLISGSTQRIHASGPASWGSHTPCALWSRAAMLKNLGSLLSSGVFRSQTVSESQLWLFRAVGIASKSSLLPAGWNHRLSTMIARTNSDRRRLRWRSSWSRFALALRTIPVFC